MTEFTQTWWNLNLPNRMEEFNSWVGNKNAQSKIYCRKIVREGNYKSLVDLGCGTATEFFAYKEEYPELKYLGVDSCKSLYDQNEKMGVPMLLASVEDTKLEDGQFDVVFVRHVLEHQPTFQPTLEEMIRIGSQLAMHVFFMIPRDELEAIGYDAIDNLYHNRYDKRDIEKFLKNHPKVVWFEWHNINISENVLMIHMK